MVEKVTDDSENTKFCPLLTVVRAGQANYMVCQSSCVFFVDGECVFITASKALKEIMKSENAGQKAKK